MNRTGAIVAACLSLPLVVGCLSSSTSQGSSESSSDSSGSFSDSSRSSSGESQTSFLRDVRAYAARFAKDGGEVEAFERDLGAIARSHGVLDWEADDGTYRELGGGFAEAGVEDARFTALAAELAGSDPRKRALLYHGYAAHAGR